MMRTGFPDFATVLKETKAQNEGHDHAHRTYARVASAVFSADLNPVSPVSTAGSSIGKTSPLFDAHDLQSDEDSLQREMLKLSKRMENQSSAAIRTELGLCSGMKRLELQRLRRSFAAENHPDRLPQEFRLAAEQRMKTANALIDRAMTEATSTV